MATTFEPVQRPLSAPSEFHDWSQSDEFSNGDLTFSSPSAIDAPIVGVCPSSDPRPSPGTCNGQVVLPSPLENAAEDAPPPSPTLSFVMRLHLTQLVNSPIENANGTVAPPTSVVSVREHVDDASTFADFEGHTPDVLHHLGTAIKTVLEKNIESPLENAPGDAAPAPTRAPTPIPEMDDLSHDAIDTVTPEWTQLRNVLSWSIDSPIDNAHGTVAPSPSRPGSPASNALVSSGYIGYTPRVEGDSAAELEKTREKRRRAREDTFAPTPRESMYDYAFFADARTEACAEYSAEAAKEGTPGPRTYHWTAKVNKAVPPEPAAALEELEPAPIADELSPANSPQDLERPDTPVARSGSAVEVNVEFDSVGEASVGEEDFSDSSLDIETITPIDFPLPPGLLPQLSAFGFDMTLPDTEDSCNNSDRDSELSIEANVSNGSTDFHFDHVDPTVDAAENDTDAAESDNDSENVPVDRSRACSPGGVGPSASTSRPTAPETPPRRRLRRSEIEARLQAAAAGEARMRAAESERPSEWQFTEEELNLPAPYVETDFDIPVRRPIPGVPDEDWLALYPRW